MSREKRIGKAKGNKEGKRCGMRREKRIGKAKENKEEKTCGMGRVVTEVNEDWTGEGGERNGRGR